MDVKRILTTKEHHVQPGFVSVMLTEKCRDIYYGHVKQATESLGLQCESFLDRKTPEDALEVIVESIQKAEILIYDITDFPPNVMWELGVGSALKDAEKVIVIREATKTPLPFNIYSNRVTYEYDRESPDSLIELSSTLKEVLKTIKSSIKPPRIKSPEVISLFKGALDAVEKGQWVPAQALFQIMDSKEPKNWYLYNQWGMMLRAKGDEFEAAADRFNKALTFTEFEDDKAFVYTELGVLNQKTRKYPEAEDWFKRAERADNKNSRLYIAWAEYYDELGDYFNAQAKIGGALGLLRLKDDDPEYNEFMIRHEYYGRKIQGYRKPLEIFVREKARGERKPPPLEPKQIKQNGNGSSGSSLPYDINWEDLMTNYVNAVVEGEISNINTFGIFVRLSREFTGLVFHRNLSSDYGEQYSRNQRVKVRITKAFVDSKDQRPKIDLRMVG